MKLAIVENLDLDDIKVFSKVDLRTYQICVPALFKSVNLNAYASLACFLDNVPRSYLHHIQELDLCTRRDNISTSQLTTRAQTETVVSLLLACPCLTKLALRMSGSLDMSVISSFACLPKLKQLMVVNCAPEEQLPLSERLVVSIAATIPALEQLSLDNISRSQMHAPDLRGVYPIVPLVFGDDDIPDHPLLGSELSLPSLLRIPTLRKLIIRDTHLGDPQWSTTAVACRLEALDLGGCCHETEEFNQVCTERIMAAVGPTVDEFSLATAVSAAVFAKPSATPLRRLRKLHITPFFPLDSVVDTMSNLAGSPIETLSMQCFEDDVVDACSALQDFLNVRAERGNQFYEKLARIDVSVTPNDELSSPTTDAEERTEATKRLQDFCKNLSLASAVGVVASDPALRTARIPASNSISDDEKLMTFCDQRLDLSQ